MEIGNDAAPTIEVLAGASHGPTALSTVVITPAIAPLGGRILASATMCFIIKEYV
ncbi:hypothetical protein D9M71_772720 [compost metagenome]